MPLCRSDGVSTFAASGSFIRATKSLYRHRAGILWRKGWVWLTFSLTTGINKSRNHQKKVRRNVSSLCWSRNCLISPRRKAGGHTIIEAMTNALLQEQSIKMRRPPTVQMIRPAQSSTDSTTASKDNDSYNAASVKYLKVMVPHQINNRYFLHRELHW